MKILSAAQLAEVDQKTISSPYTTSIKLMESAAKQFVSWYIDTQDTKKAVRIFCGMGNNGGDGLAIARLLYQENIDVKVYIIRHTEKVKVDVKKNEERLRDLQTVPVYDITNESNLPKIEANEIIVDSILGTGLNREVKAESLIGKVINHINSLPNQVVAVDIPSGFFADKPTNGIAIKADTTLTFELPKFSYLFAQSFDYVGEWATKPIGLDVAYINKLDTDNYYITKDLVEEIVDKHPRLKFSHKGDYGHVLIVGGSSGKLGAAQLAAASCLKSGTGLVTAHIPSSAFEIFQINLPEIMVQIDNKADHISNIENFDKFDVLAIGPGLGTHHDTLDALDRLLELSELDTKLVLDADALNLISKNKEFLEMLPPYTILTPHPKEFERLAGKAKDDFERYDIARGFAHMHNVYLVLKGAHTMVVNPEGKVFFNSTGNPGMATGGSGDVLTGMIAAFLAQGYSNEEACIVAVYLHGLAGDLAAFQQSQYAMTANSIIENLPDAFLSLAN